MSGGSLRFGLLGDLELVRDGDPGRAENWRAALRIFDEIGAAKAAPVRSHHLYMALRAG
jgi:hypothetical protein